MAKPTLILVGALPPPHHGQTVFTEALLKSRLPSHFSVYHLDTSDSRSIANIGALDLRNAFLAVKNILQLAFQCRRIKPAIVYIPNSQNNWGFFRDGLLILVAKVFSRAKIVMHYHGGESFIGFRRSTNAFMRWFITVVLRRVDLGIVVGERLRGVFEEDVKTVVAVPNGITSDARLEYRERTNNESVTVSFLSNLLKSKGILDFLDAAAKVVRQQRSVRFKVAGVWWKQEPETEAQAHQIVVSNGLKDHVEFCGFVIGEQKARFLCETDIFVFPTWNDSFGLVILEAMAAGCPVVSTRGVGAIEEVVVDGVTGILVEKQNPQQIAEAIGTLIENPDLRRRMGEAGRKRYEALYTFDKCVERMIEVFSRVMSNTARSRSDGMPTRS